MNCESARLELMECARRGGNMPAALSAHVDCCESCRIRWQSEQDLSTHLRALRIPAIPEGHEWGKAALMLEFGRRRRHLRRARWMWAASAAAVLAVGAFTIRDIGQRHGDMEPTAAAQPFTPREYPQETFALAEEAGEEGFIRLPFALPPVPGETFGIVRTELNPAQLARMGVRVDAGWSGTVEADVLVGQDGLAQAVRLSTGDETLGADVSGAAPQGY
ncbi:MAG TPA: hypothetical protein VFT60_10260 [Bryobacteraceae bacterium]|jgi:hypothetical protein|nr:hypothetical protein [Bryobacteraceae bacterium]